jgi:hypothetical protein
MKKIALFVSVLLLAGSLFADAPVFEAKPGISGSATLTFGVALDNPVATGFFNDSSTNITLGLVNKGSDEKGGKEGEEVYGWIKLKDFELKVDGELKIGKPGIEAKLFLGPVFINILGVDDTTNKAGLFNKAVIGATTNDVTKSQKPEFKGFAIGLKDSSVVDLTVGVTSKFDWTGSTAASAATYKLDTSSATPAVVVDKAAAAATSNANTSNVYDFYVGVAVKAVPGLTAELAANLTTETTAAATATTAATTAGVIGAAAKVGYEVAIAEGMKLTPSVGFDLTYNTAAGATTPMAYQLSGDVSFVLPGGKKKVKFTEEVEYAPGVNVKFTMDSATTSNMDLGVYVFDGDIIPVLDLLAVFEMNALGQTGSLMGIGVNASATIDMLSPYAKFSYAQTAVAPATPAAKTLLEVGVDIKAITNTTFTLKYTSGNLTATTAELGKITFDTKIAF